MPKNWWFKFDFKTWRTDSDLRRCSLETRGFWLEILAALHEAEEWKISGTVAELARLVGCEKEVAQRCIDELDDTDTADITLSFREKGGEKVDVFTIISRRMKRELSNKTSTRKRVKKLREKVSNGVSNGLVTDLYEPALNKVISKESEVISKSLNNNVDQLSFLPRSEAEAPPQKKKSKRGTRLPDDFLVDGLMQNWVREKFGIEFPWATETEKFRNYWSAKSGKDATKLDWEATWRNWMIKAYEQLGQNRNSTGGYRAERHNEAVVSRNRRDQIRRNLDNTGNV